MNSIKRIIMALMMSMTGMAIAQGVPLSAGSNNVYIEQIGNSNTITIEQVGGTNNIGGISSTTPSDTNYATINGSNNVLALTQTGDNNLSQYYIRGSTNTYTSTFTGNNNVSKLEIGNSLNTNNLRNVITETVTGDDNTLTTLVIGNDITVVATISGNLNVVDSILKSTNGVSDLLITGNNNKLDIEQLDVSGAIGHILTQNIVGDYNSIVTQQQGTNDTNIDIKITGDHNTITVRSSSSAIVGSRTAVAR